MMQIYKTSCEKIHKNQQLILKSTFMMKMDKMMKICVLLSPSYKNGIFRVKSSDTLLLEDWSYNHPQSHRKKNTVSIFLLHTDSIKLSKNTEGVRNDFRASENNNNKKAMGRK